MQEHKHRICLQLMKRGIALSRILETIDSSIPVTNICGLKWIFPHGPAIQTPTPLFHSMSHETKKWQCQIPFLCEHDATVMNVQS